MLVQAECQEKMEEQRKRKGIVCQRIAAAAMLLNVGFSADLESQSKRELERREEVLAEMTRQFNEMQNSFTDRIVDLKEQVKRAQEDIGNCSLRRGVFTSLRCSVEVENMKETTRREKDDEIARKVRGSSMCLCGATVEA